jgi:hypothetical protein
LQDRIEPIPKFPAPTDDLNGLFKISPEPRDQRISTLPRRKITLSACLARQMQHPNHSPANGSKFPPIRK